MNHDKELERTKELITKSVGEIVRACFNTSFEKKQITDVIDRECASIFRDVTSYADKQVRAERERVRKWVETNYSRSSSPVWAHVDLVDLLKTINPSVTTYEEEVKTDV